MRPRSRRTSCTRPRRPIEGPWAGRWAAGGGGRAAGIDPRTTSRRRVGSGRRSPHERRDVLWPRGRLVVLGPVGSRRPGRGAPGPAGRVGHDAGRVPLAARQLLRGRLFVPREQGGRRFPAGDGDRLIIPATTGPPTPG